MQLSNAAFDALEEVLGKEFVTRDPVKTMAYSRCFTSSKMRPPACVALPKDREDVRKIFRLANKHDFKVIPTGTHLMASCEPTIEGLPYVTIDPKRMDGLFIDEKNMIAVVEPYVTFARLQVEAMKHGLTTYIPSAGSQISVLANLVFQGFNMQSYRLGAGNRSILSMEWVLPDGMLLHTGSASVLRGDYFWGEGPGADLRGMLKGTWGHFGGLGMCTRIGIKLHPWTGPKILPTRGATPDRRCHLPKENFRTFTIDFPSLDNLIEAMYEIGHAEIASRCIHMRKGWHPTLESHSLDGFWEKWEDPETLASTNSVLLVVLEAYTHPKQLDYEEDVLKEIVAETNGTFLTGDYLESAATIMGPDLLIRPNLLFRGFRAAGNFISVKLGHDSLDHSARLFKNGLKITNWFIRNKTPPFVANTGECGYINPYDFGHMAHHEFPVIYEAKPGVLNKALTLLSYQILDDIVSGAYPGGFLFGPINNLMGPIMGKFHKPIQGIKMAFDPNNVSNPPWPMPIMSTALKEMAGDVFSKLKRKAGRTSNG